MALLLFFGIITLCSTVIGGKQRPGCFTARHVCPNAHISFWLQSKKTGYERVEVTEGNLHEQPFLLAPLKIIIHGYEGHKGCKSNNLLISAYLEKKSIMEYNILIVDWGKMAQAGCYKEALRNYRVAGKCAARLLNKFYSLKGVQWKNITHVIGFGLGAHVAGVVGHELQNLKRITGLDPDLQGFNKKDYPTEKKLDSTVADYVDIYHSNSGKIGMLYPVGKLDFYLNNGKYQPGCISSSCSHYRAVEVFAESIHNAKDAFPGKVCKLNHKVNQGLLSSISKLIKDVCSYTKNSTLVVTSGEGASKGAKGLFKVETNRKAPFSKTKYDKTNSYRRKGKN